MSFDAWGKRREVDWTALSGPALLAFDTSITTRGYTGHEMLDSVGLVHMNGRVYDAEIGRFLSADPNIQDVENFQNWNRYTYVLNNPLSYTDPSGFFFSKIFKAIGNFFKSVFEAIGSVFKALLKIPLIRSAIQIVACGVGPITCTLAAGALTLLAGGSILEAVQAMAFSAAQMGIWDVVGSAITGPLQAAMGAVDGVMNAASVGFATVKGAIHGVVGGAISVAQGGNFLEGFAANAIGASAGVFAMGVSNGDLFVEAALVGVAGGAAAVAFGGKFANGALTAAMAHLYNGRGRLRRGNGREFNTGAIRVARYNAVLREIRGLDPTFRPGPSLRSSGIPTNYEIRQLEFHRDVLARIEPTLNRIFNGIKHPHRNDGSVFKNREGLLPRQPVGYYREYVVPTPNLNHAGSQRLIFGRSGETFYTRDHYRTFYQVR